MRRGTLLLVLIVTFTALAAGVAPWQYERTCTDTWIQGGSKGICDTFAKENDGGSDRLNFDSCNLSQTASDLSVKNPNVSTPVIEPGNNLSATCTFELQDEGADNKLFLFYHNGKNWTHIKNFTNTGIGEEKPTAFTESFTVERSGEQWIRCAITREPDDIQELGSIVKNYCATNNSDYQKLHDNDDTDFYVDTEKPVFSDSPTTQKDEVNLGQGNTVSFTVADTSATWLQNNKKYDESGKDICTDTNESSCSLDDNGLQNVSLTVRDGANSIVAEKDVEDNLSTGSHTHAITAATVDTAGVWNITVEAKDLAGNTQTRFTTFEASDELDVSFSGFGSSDTYSKGSSISFASTDVNGNRYAADWTATITGPNSFTASRSSTRTSASFSFTVEQDWPVGDYTADVSAAKQGNSGSTTYSFTVTDVFDLTVTNTDQFRDQTFSPAAAFSVYPIAELTYQGSGEPISEATVTLNCLNQDLEQHTITYTETGDGTYEKTSDEQCYASQEYSDQVTVSLTAEKNGSTTSTTLTGQVRDAPADYSESVATIPDITVETPRSGQRIYESQHATVPIHVTTDLQATCEYSTMPHQDWAYGSGTAFTETGTVNHSTLYTPRTYQQNTVFIKCWPEEQRSGTTGKQAGETQTQFTYIPVEELNFTITEKNNGFTVTQGEPRTVKLFAIRNTGNIELPLTLNITRNPTCCAVANLSDLETHPIGIQSKRNIHLTITPALNKTTGNHSVTVTAVSGDRRDETQVIFTVNPSPIAEKLEEVKTRLANTEKRVNQLQRNGVDVSEASTVLRNVSRAVTAAEHAQSRNQAASFRNHVETAADQLDDAERTVLQLEFLNFLRENRWGIILLTLIVNLVGITEIYIIYPFLVLRDRLHTLREKEQDAVEEREELEQQYFTRTLEKSTFEEMVVRKQEAISDIRSEIKELETLLTPQHIVKHPKSLHNHVKTLDEEPSFTERLLQQLNAATTWVTSRVTAEPEETGEQVTPRDVDTAVEEEAAASPGADTLSIEEKKDVLLDVLQDAESLITNMEPGRMQRRMHLHLEALQKSVERTTDEDELDDLATEVKQFMERVQEHTSA